MQHKIKNNIHSHYLIFILTIYNDIHPYYLQYSSILSTYLQPCGTRVYIRLNAVIIVKDIRILMVSLSNDLFLGKWPGIGAKCGLMARNMVHYVGKWMVIARKINEIVQV